MSAGTVAAIASTFGAATAVLDAAAPVPAPPAFGPSVFWAQPDSVSAPAIMNTAALRPHGITR
jgi:hypothetical protein